MPITTAAWAAQDSKTPLAHWTYQLQELGSKDIHIKVQWCGVCHSDIHQARNEWKNSIYPMVPGHEIVGIVEAVGKDVTTFKKGDKAGVGCLVSSCKKCHSCDNHLEQYCGSPVYSYNSKYPNGQIAFGGYGRDVICREDFALHWPEKLDMRSGAPLLCAGITTYSPIIHFGMNKPGTKVAVNGLGGLGHMAVKFLVSFGCEVTVLSRSPSKEQEVKEVLKAQKFLLTTDKEAVKKVTGYFDFIIDTVSANHDINMLLGMVHADGKVVLVGAPDTPLAVAGFALIAGRKTLAGSSIGGIQETQLMLNYCADKDITCMVEQIKAEEINTAYERTINSDVRYRFVIDVANTTAPPK